MSTIANFPKQQLAYSQKTKKWRKQHLEWAEGKTYLTYEPVRKSVDNKIINRNLLAGRLSMKDMELVLNPYGIKSKGGLLGPDTIQHYPIMNSKLNILRGEESRRPFDYRVIVTNPLAISEKEDQRKEELFQNLQQLYMDTSLSEEEFNQKLEELNEYYTYEWQDLREIRANSILNHYIKEYNLPQLFNDGFMHAFTYGEEIYQCDIRGGEPVIDIINPLNIRAFRSGWSSKFEDADVVIIEEYWQPGKIIDAYYDVLSNEDVKYIENLPNFGFSGNVDDMWNTDPRNQFVLSDGADAWTPIGEVYGEYLLNDTPYNGSKRYFDAMGNVRVLRMYWRSRRKVKKVTAYDLETGEEYETLYPENYIADTSLGEEVDDFWINEAWEATKIGAEIYVNMRPRLVQYNRLSSPSRCHFGIIGSVYNLNDDKPFSLVDMMKPYNYLYNAIHDRLNKAIARNWGKMIRMDLSRVPKGWEPEKWLHYARNMGILAENPFNEGQNGRATGVLAGNMQRGQDVIDAETGNYIQQHINLLEYIKAEMAEVVGISKQREGQISNRETVGGVERATLQSSHITEWLFRRHDDIKRRVLECFLETAKIAFRGNTKKIQYILSDMSIRIMDIDGDEFAEADYGLIVDNADTTQQQLDSLKTFAQAALQNGLLSFSTLIDIDSTASMAEKRLMIKRDEANIQQAQQEAQERQLEVQREASELQFNLKQAELAQRDAANIRDNETKILIEQMKLSGNAEFESDISPDTKAKLMEQMREFDAQMKFDNKKHQDEIAVKREAIRSKQTNIVK